MRKSSKKSGKRIWPWAVGLLGLLVIGVAVYVFMFYNTVTQTIEEIHEPIERERSERRIEKVTLTEREPFSVLLLGVDAREGEAGRSDTIVVLTVNPDDESTKMVSIPRDTYTEIIGLGFMDKINHAFAFGGVEMSMNTVENLLDIPIDYAISVNMDGFEEVVDAVGGIEVNNPFPFDEFDRGLQHLDGREALDYVRMRKQDPRGDFGRQDRQRQVVQGIIREGASINSLFNYQSIFDSLGRNLRTNMTFDEMVEVQRNYRDVVGSVDQIIISEGHGETIDGIWYYMMDEDELADIQSRLREHLEL